MVRLEHVNKYFNRKRKNEIHVINDTTVSMGDKGLIAFLGPSGCGKTTLLNVIGGLDRIHSGSVYVNGEKITGRRAGAVDRIRNLNIGYIFQNYNLVDSMTVFENVAIALRMVGVKDEKEIEDKVGYVLEKVGMERYRNRYADMLSGGERQRVGIARAIVKDPAIIIADEPTGNLDSANTLEVMNIIKDISKEKLVILVTHEERLASFYASRIIRILDGRVVSDEANEGDTNLDYRIDSRVYLKDIRDHKRLKTGDYKVDFYNESGDDIDLDIVIRNGNIYIRTNRKEDRIEIVDSDSSIEFIDDHYHEMTKDDTDSGFDMERLEPSGERRYRSVFGPASLIKKGFRAVFGYNALKKVLLLGFLITAMFITYSVSSIFGVLDITDDEFVEKDKSYITIVGKKIPVDTYLAYESGGDFEYIMPGDSMISMSMAYDDYLQTSGYSAAVTGSLSDVEKLGVNDLAEGRLPENPQEIVVDRMVLERVIDDQGSVMAGFGRPADFLEETVSVPHMPDMTIVGISDLESPCIYTDRSLFMNLIANAVPAEDIANGTYAEGGSSSGSELIDYQLMTSGVTLEDGSWPAGDYQVLVNEKNKEDMKIGSEIDTRVNGHKLKVSGYYSDPESSDYMLVNSNTVKYDVISSTANITASAKNKQAALSKLEEDGVNAIDAYEESRKEYRDEMWSSIFSTLVMSGVILIISFIEIFLMIRASFLSRVREIGVYRAIGMKKGDIYRMFIGEIFAITTMTGLPGYLVMAYMLYRISAMSYFSQMFIVNIPVLAISLALIYGFNLLFGLMPVWQTIRKPPAAILSRSDIN